MSSENLDSPTGSENSDVNVTASGSSDVDPAKVEFHCKDNMDVPNASENNGAKVTAGGSSDVNPAKGGFHSK